MKREGKKGRMHIHPGIFLLTAVLLLFAVTFGLRYWERFMEKPRLLKSIQALIQDHLSEDYAMDELWELLAAGKTSQNGYINISHVEQSALLKGTWEQMKALNGSSITYEWKRDMEKRQMSFHGMVNLRGKKQFEINGYGNQEQTLVQIPQLHENYLMAENENIRTQYENSFLYTVFGEEIPLPNEEVSIELFDQEVFPEQSFRREMIQFLERHEAEQKGWKEQIQISKRKNGEQMFANGIDIPVSVYEVTIPVSLIRTFYEESVSEVIKEWTQRFFSWEEEIIPIVLYVDDHNQIRKISAIVTPEFKKTPLPLEVKFERKGQERLSDEFDIELQVLYEQKTYAFRFDLTNIWEEQETRVIHIKAQMTAPFIFKALDADVNYAKDGTTSMEYEVDTPFLAIDGEHEVKAFSGEIPIPDGAVTDIFHMNLLEMMQFTRSLNFDFFQSE